MTAKQTRGGAFRAKTEKQFQLTDVETELLAEVCRTLDEIDLLEAALKADGVTVAGSTGQVRVHPAVAEIRSHRLALSRMMAQLDLPDAEGETLPAGKQVRGRAAARARWGSVG